MSSMVVLSTRLGHAACCARREGLSGKILLVLSESTGSVSTSAHFGSTSRSLRGGEVGKMHRGGSTKACGCRKIRYNHCQLQTSWWWPADRLGARPGDPRYFTSCRACRGHHSGWARPTTAPSHEARYAICRGRVIRRVGECLLETCESAWRRIQQNRISPFRLMTRIVNVQTACVRPRRFEVNFGGSQRSPWQIFKR